MDDGKRSTECIECGGKKEKWWYKYCSPECAHRAAAKAYQRRHRRKHLCVRCPRRARKGFVTCGNHPDSRSEKSERKAA